MKKENNDKINIKSAIGAGLIAAIAMFMVEMILIGLFTDMSLWAPPRMMAAIVMGKRVLEPATFNFGIVMVSMVVHLTLSIIYTIILGLLIRQKGVGASVFLGMLFGLALYFINFYGFTALFPWFAMARNWISIVAHLIFGMTAAFAYKKISLTHPKIQVTT